MIFILQDQIVEFLHDHTSFFARFRRPLVVECVVRGLHRLFSVLLVAIGHTADLGARRRIENFERFTGLRRDPFAVDESFIEEGAIDSLERRGKTKERRSFEGKHSI